MSCENDHSHYVIITENGERVWHADNEQHAREQHTESFPDEKIIQVQKED